MLLALIFCTAVTITIFINACIHAIALKGTTSTIEHPESHRQTQSSTGGLAHSKAMNHLIEIQALIMSGMHCGFGDWLT